MGLVVIVLESTAIEFHHVLLNPSLSICALALLLTTKSKTVLEMPYTRALHEAPTPVMLVLERTYIFQLLSAEIYICLFHHACWLYCPSHMYFRIFCLLDLLITERDVLKYYTMIVDLSWICFRIFGANSTFFYRTTLLVLLPQSRASSINFSPPFWL